MPIEIKKLIKPAIIKKLTITEDSKIFYFENRLSELIWFEFNPFSTFQVSRFLR